MTITPELEAVARALHDGYWVDGYPGGFRLLKWDELSSHVKGDAYRAARAALLAIREPTRNMIDAAVKAESQISTDESYAKVVLESHRAMIDHALGDQP